MQPGNLKFKEVTDPRLPSNHPGLFATLYKIQQTDSKWCIMYGPADSSGMLPHCSQSLLQSMHLLRLAGLLGLLGSGAFAALEGRPRAFFGALPSASGAAGSSCAFSPAALPFPCKASVPTCSSIHNPFPASEHSGLPCLSSGSSLCTPYSILAAACAVWHKYCRTPRRLKKILPPPHHRTGAALACSHAAEAFAEFLDKAIAAHLIWSIYHKTPVCTHSLPGSFSLLAKVEGGKFAFVLGGVLGAAGRPLLAGGVAGAGAASSSGVASSSSAPRTSSTGCTSLRVFFVAACTLS